MKNKTVNKKILRAMSIGIAAMMTVQPILATPVFADEEAPEKESEPAVAEAEAVKNDSFESNDASDGLGEIREAVTEAATDTNTNNCGNDLDYAVCSARDTDDSKFTNWDKIYGGKDLSDARDAIINDKTGINYYDDKFAVVETSAETPSVLDVEAERAILSDDAKQLAADAKRGVDNNFNKTGGDNKDFDARVIMETVNSMINSNAYTDAAANLDTAVTEESEALATLYADMEKADKTIDQAVLDIDVALNDLENAETEEAANEAYEKVGKIQEEAQSAYEIAKAEYEAAYNEYQQKQAEIEELRKEYSNLLEGQLGYTADDGRTAAQAQEELKLALENVSKLESDAIIAQDNLKNTVIGNLTQTLADTSKPGTPWNTLDGVLGDLIKYYYFPSIGIDPSDVVVDEKFTKDTKDSSKNYLKATVGDTPYYFNYKRANTEGQNSGNIVIFMKNPEASTEVITEEKVTANIEATAKATFKSKIETTIDLGDNNKELDKVIDLIQKKLSENYEGSIERDGNTIKLVYYKTTSVEGKYTQEDAEVIDGVADSEEAKTVAAEDAKIKAANDSKAAIQDIVEIIEGLHSDYKGSGNSTLSHIADALNGQVDTTVTVEQDGEAETTAVVTYNTTTTEVERTTYEKIPTRNDNFTNYMSDKENNSNGILDMTDKNLEIYQDVEKYNTLLSGYENVETRAATAKSKIQTAKESVDNLVEKIKGEVKNLDPTNPEGKLFKRLSQLGAQLTAAQEKLKSAEENKNIVDKVRDEAFSLIDSIIDKITKAPEVPEVAPEETTEETKEEIKEEEAKEETKEEAGEDAKEEAKGEAGEDAEEETKEEAKEEAGEDAEEETKEEAGEETKEEAGEDAEEETKEETKEEAGEDAEEETKEEVKEETKEETKEEDENTSTTDTVVIEIEVPTTPEEKVEEKAEEKVEEKVEEKTEEKAEEKAEEKTEEKAEEKVEEKTEEKAEEKAEEKTEEKAEEKAEEKTEDKTEEKNEKPASTPASAEAATPTPAQVTPILPSAPILPVTPIAPISPIALTAPVVTPEAGVAGARVDNTSASNGGIHSESEVDETTGEILEGGEIVETKPELIAGKLFEESIDMTKFEGMMDKNTITTITDEKVPLSALPENENQKISWWWLLIIAILGTTGEEMYRRNKEKKEKAALESEENK